MALSPIEIGAIGGVAVFVVKESFSLVTKIVNKRNSKNNLEPGFAEICIERGEKIREHDIVLKHLCQSITDAAEKVETMRKENRHDLERIFTVLDTINKRNGG